MVTRKHFIGGGAIGILVGIGLMVLAMATVAMAPVHAFAQTVAAVPQAPAVEPDGTVSLIGLINSVTGWITDLAITGLFALLAIVAKWVKDKWKIDMEAKLKAIEASHRSALHSAISTAVGSLVNKWGSGLVIDVKSEGLAEILRYLRDSVPDALNALQPDNQVIADIANAKVAQLTASPTNTPAAPKSPGDGGTASLT